MGWLGLSAWLRSRRPAQLIFDNELGNDIDDVIALSMIHKLQSRSTAQLLAVTSNKDHPQAAVFTDAVNTCYGCGSRPTGVVRNGAAQHPGRLLALTKVRSGARQSCGRAGAP